MNHIPIEVTEKLSGCQPQIWQTVSQTVSEAAGVNISFSMPLAVVAKTSDLYSEMGAPMMVLQFAFASLPENPQVVLIPQETVVGLASLIKGEKVSEVDENTTAELRNTMEAVVQGICLAVGNLRNDTVVATGLSIRFQIFSFPPNLQRSIELARTNVAIASDELNGAAIWLMDSETAHSVVNITPVAEDDVQFVPAAASVSAEVATEDPANGLELLLDIPLEISVELGRVRMLVREVVELGAGSIVEIDKTAGEPVDVMVNGRLVARGEVVVIEDNFGVRITEILNPQERLARLGDAA
jgi:flagellar motor switch protein FliN/FliY